MSASMQLDAAWLGLGIGVIAFVALWLVIANAWHRQSLGDQLPDKDIIPGPVGTVDEYPDGLAEAHGHVTTFLKVTALFFVAWTVGYIAVFLNETMK